MRPERIEITIDEQLTTWIPGSEPTSILVAKENQVVKITVILAGDDDAVEPPILFIEDYNVPLHSDNRRSENGSWIFAFSSSPEKAFRESFGHSTIRLICENHEFKYHIEVLATKITAAQAEKMIRYLADCREGVIRACMSRTKRPAGLSPEGRADPEIVLSTAEHIIQMLLNQRAEFIRHLRYKLTPEKVPAWKLEKSGGQIDPIDVIFNLDALRPTVGRGDVMLRGRNYSTQSIDTSMLHHDYDVDENRMLLGGLYSIRTKIMALMDDIGDSFRGQKIANYDKEYVSIGEILIKFTGGAMHRRCEQVIEAAASMIVQLERNFDIEFRGEIFPRITPYVRTSRFYRPVFEQLTLWFSIGSPTLDGKNFLIKLRSLSKIFEFFVLFRLFEYMVVRGWMLDDVVMGESFDRLIPSSLTFSKNEVIATINYEADIYKFNGETEHMDLVKLPHRAYPGAHWCPDFAMRLTSAGEVRHILLDAKYSNSFSVDRYKLPELRDKYYDHMAVFNGEINALSRNEITGVFAIFPEFLDQTPNPIGTRIDKLGGSMKNPVLLPITSGLPVSFRTNSVLEKCFDRIIEITLLTMGIEAKVQEELQDAA